MEKIAKLIAEIERLMDIQEETCYLNKESFNSGRWKGLTMAISLINSMLKEPVNDDLEKEIDNYINSHFAEGCDGGMISDKHKDLGGVHYKDLIDLAEHFANWQKQKDEKILAKNNDEYTEGVKGKYTTTTK